MERGRRANNGRRGESGREMPGKGRGGMK